MEYITTTEVAAAIGLDRSRIIQLITAGKLQPIGKLPGKTGAHLFDPADISAWIDERQESEL